MGLAAAVGRVLMSKLGRMYTSVSSMIKAARDLDQAYEYSVMRQDASFFLQAHRLENTFVHFDPNRLVTKNRMVETRFKREAAFRVYGLMKTVDLETGRTTVAPASMYTNFRGSLNQYQQEFISNYEFDARSKYYGRLQIISFAVDTVVHNRKYGYAEYPELQEL
jgi:hypothetical protein